MIVTITIINYNYQLNLKTNARESQIGWNSTEAIDPFLHFRCGVFQHCVALISMFENVCLASRPSARFIKWDRFLQPKQEKESEHSSRASITPRKYHSKITDKKASSWSPLGFQDKDHTDQLSRPFPWSCPCNSALYLDISRANSLAVNPMPSHAARTSMETGASSSLRARVVRLNPASDGSTWAICTRRAGKLERAR